MADAKPQDVQRVGGKRGMMDMMMGGGGGGGGGGGANKRQFMGQNMGGYGGKPNMGAMGAMGHMMGMGYGNMMGMVRLLGTAAAAVTVPARGCQRSALCGRCCHLSPAVLGSSQASRHCPSVLATAALSSTFQALLVYLLACCRGCLLWLCLSGCPPCPGLAWPVTCGVSC
jgi:hypothetical protein